MNFRRSEVQQGFADDLVARSPKHPAHRVVHFYDCSIVVDRNPFDRRSPEFAELRFACPKRKFHAFALGNIFDSAVVIERSAIRVSYSAGAFAHIDDRSVMPGPGTFQAADFSVHLDLFDEVLSLIRRLESFSL